MMDETALLRRYVEDADEAAFTEIVEGRVDFVYSAALRQVGGDAHLAKDVTQGVFLALARSAPALVGRTSLAGWLYTSARFLAAKAVRSHRRWQTREQEAQTMNEREHEAAREPDWDEIRPVLDDAMHELNERDREAILLRYFENRPYAEIAATCGGNENAARMRVERALEKLRARLVRRGVTSSAAALALALSTQTISAAPAGLALSVAAVSLTGAGAAGAALNLIGFMGTTKLKIAVLGAVAAILAAGIGGYHVGRPSAGNKAVAPAGVEARAAEDARLLEESARIAASAERQAREAAALREENAKLGEQLKRSAAGGITRADTMDAATHGASTPAKQLAEDTLLKLRTVADLQKRKIASVAVTFVDRSGKIGDGFAELFGLSPVERDALQKAVDQVRQQLDATTLANAKVSRNDAAGVVIQVPPSGEGAQLYDQLFDAFGATLGPERNAAFFELGSKKVEEALNNFGAEERVITISPNPEKDGGFVLKEERKSPGSTRTSSRTTNDRAKLVEALGPIAKLLPPGF